MCLALRKGEISVELVCPKCGSGDLYALVQRRGMTGWTQLYEDMVRFLISTGPSNPREKVSCDACGYEWPLAELLAAGAGDGQD